MKLFLGVEGKRKNKPSDLMQSVMLSNQSYDFYSSLNFLGKPIQGFISMQLLWNVNASMISLISLVYLYLF